MNACLAEFDGSAKMKGVKFAKHQYLLVKKGEHWFYSDGIKPGLYLCDSTFDRDLLTFTLHILLKLPKTKKGISAQNKLKDQLEDITEKSVQIQNLQIEL